MLTFLETANHQIHLVSCKVIFQGEELKVRTKTFLLLKLLVESPGQIISKQTILNEVWDDVITDDQVIFQSIKEIRKIFNGYDVIKTHPRKGYAWISPVLRGTDDQSQQKGSKDLLISNNYLGSRKILAVSLVILLLLASVLFFNSNRNEISKGSVIILPILNELKSADQQWIRLGIMDHIIHRLPSSLLYGVLQTDDVLDVIKRANLSSQKIERKDIDNIFAVSGANIIVESRLSGSSNDYQYVYSIHERGNIKRGVILGENISVIANQLSTIIANKIDLNVPEGGVEYHSNFANEMLASALDKINTEDYVSAQALLNAAKEIEPENLVVSRHLASVLMLNRQYDDAEKLLDKAIETANAQGKVRELARLRTVLGQNYLFAERYSDSVEMLLLAERKAKEVNDWLYLGYISSTKGVAYQKQDNYLLAEKAFESSINFHKVIQCPFGQAQGIIALAELAIIQGNYEKAQSKIEHSFTLIKDRRLDELQIKALSISETIEQSKLKTKFELSLE